METKNVVSCINSSFDLEKVIRANADELGIDLECRDDQLRNLLIIIKLLIRNWVNNGFKGIYKIAGAEETLEILQDCIAVISSGFSNKNCEDCSDGIISTLGITQFVLSTMMQELKETKSRRYKKKPYDTSGEIVNGRKE